MILFAEDVIDSELELLKYKDFYEYYFYTWEDLVGKLRTERLSMVRACIVKYMYERELMTLKEIGLIFKRDRNTARNLTNYCSIYDYKFRKVEDKFKEIIK